MQPTIKSMIWNIRKQKTTNEKNKKKKRIQKNEDSVSSLWDNFKSIKKGMETIKKNQ